MLRSCIKEVGINKKMVNSGLLRFSHLVVKLAATQTRKSASNTIETSGNHQWQHERFLAQK